MSGGLSASPCPGSGSRSPRCAGAARRLSVRRPPARRPPVQALPAGPGQSPRSRELQRPAALRGSGVGPHGPFPARLAAAPAGGRDSAAGPAGVECPRQPRVQISSLRKAAPPRAMVLPRTLMPSERPQMAWSSPATVTGPWRRSRRGRGPDGDRGPFRTRARRWRCGRPSRRPSIPPPGETATGVLPSPTPPERTWTPGPKAEVKGGDTG